MRQAALFGAMVLIAGVAIAQEPGPSTGFKDSFALKDYTWVDKLRVAATSIANPAKINDLAILKKYDPNIIASSNEASTEMLNMLRTGRAYIGTPSAEIDGQYVARAWAQAPPHKCQSMFCSPAMSAVLGNAQEPAWIFAPANSIAGVEPVGAVFSFEAPPGAVEGWDIAGE